LGLFLFHSFKLKPFGYYLSWIIWLFILLLKILLLLFLNILVFLGFFRILCKILIIKVYLEPQVVLINIHEFIRFIFFRRFFDIFDLKTGLIILNLIDFLNILLFRFICLMILFVLPWGLCYFIQIAFALCFIISFEHLIYGTLKFLFLIQKEWNRSALLIILFIDSLLVGVY